MHVESFRELGKEVLAAIDHLQPNPQGPVWYYLQFKLYILTFLLMKSLVTSKGQVTIPKELRDRFGIEPGSEVDFAMAADGIRLRKIVNRRKQSKVLGCLKAELAGQSVTSLLDDLRGPVELPGGRLKATRR